MLERLYNYFLRYRLFLSVVVLVVAVLFGLLIVGPFLISPQYEKFIDITRDQPLLKSLVDIQAILVSKIVASTIPFFVVWSIVLFIYSVDRRFSITSKSISEFLSIYTGGVGVIVATMGGVLLGIFVFGIFKNIYSLENLSVGVLAVLLIVAGILMKSMSKPIIEDRDWIHRHSLKFALICLVLAAFSYFYGVFSDLIGLWGSINLIIESKNG